MNRPIKFRGKRIDNGQWVYGWLLGDKQPFIVSNFIIDRFVRLDMKCPNLAISDIYEVDPETVGQFTIQIDKDNREIYEGDYVEFEDCTYSPATGEYNDFLNCGEVCFDHDPPMFYVSSRYSIHTDDFDWITSKIVGNIHDNPDLLEKNEAKSSESEGV